MTQAWRLTSRSKNRRSAARWSFLVGTPSSRAWRYSPTSLGLEELLPGEFGGAASGLDDGRRVAGGHGLAAGRERRPGPHPDRRRSRSLNRPFFDIPPGPDLMIDNALCLSLNRPGKGGRLWVGTVLCRALLFRCYSHPKNLPVSPLLPQLDGGQVSQGSVGDFVTSIRTACSLGLAWPGLTAPPVPAHPFGRSVEHPG